MAVAQRYQVVPGTTVTAGTPIAAPLAVPIDLGDLYVQRVYIRMPPGPSGLVGVALDFNGTRIVPFDQPGQWLVGDDEKWELPLNLEIDNGAQVTLYNLDTFDHAPIVSLLAVPISLISSATLSTTTPVPISQPASTTPTPVLADVGGIDLTGG